MSADTWLKDARGNRASADYFGSQEAAQAALDSLKNCDECTNCSDCSDCSGCSGCADCRNIAFLLDKTAVNPVGSQWAGPPPVPSIENIDAKVFAGDAGYALERFHNTPLAAQLIYEASGSPINPCRFYDGNTDALADMKKRAEGETAS